MTPLQEADDLFIRTEVIAKAGVPTNLVGFRGEVFVTCEGEHPGDGGFYHSFLSVDDEPLISSEEISSIESAYEDDDESQEQIDETVRRRTTVLTERIARSLELTRRIPLLLLRSMTDGDIDDAVWDAVKSYEEAQSARQGGGSEA